MKATLLLAMAALTATSPLEAQSAIASLSGDSGGEFRDLGIVELVDATDALLDPALRSKLARPEAPDAVLCSPDTLLFCEQDPLAPGDPCDTTTVHAARKSSAPTTLTTLVPALNFSENPADRLVACAESGDGDRSPISSLHPVLAGAAPVPADQVPEPSAVLLVVGAAAWILLRRKY